MKGLKGWIGMTCALVMGCAQEPQAPQNSSQRIESLLTENRRLHNELLEARKEIVQWKEMSKVTSGKEVKAKTEKSDVLIEEQGFKVKQVEEKPLLKERESPSVGAACNGHLQVQMNGNPDAIIPLIEGRLKGWGLERLQVLNGREEGTLDIFFSGFKGGVLEARKSLEGTGGLSVHEVETTELTPFQITEGLPNFQALFPEEGSRVKVVQKDGGPGFATSTRSNDIEVFAKQIIHRAPQFSIFPGPADQPGIWRTRTVVAAPRFTGRHLVQASTTTDEQGTTLLLKFRKKTKTGIPMNKKDQKAPLAFVLDGSVIRILSIPAEGIPPFRRVELNLPHLPAEQATIEVKRLASLLTYPGRLMAEVLLAEEECVNSGLQ